MILKSKKAKIFAILGIALLLFLVVVPPITRRWYAKHSVKLPSVIPMNSWKKFSSDEGKFSVWFPGTPQERTEVMSGTVGNLEVHVVQTEFDKQNAYVVGYADIPQNTGLQNPQTYFDKAEVLEAGENGKITFHQETEFKGYPGREFEFVAGGKANYSGRVRVFLVQRRMYRLATVFLTANPHPEDWAVFFKSFQLAN